MSFAMREPTLREKAPPSLRRAGPLCPSFDQVRDPLIAAQLRDLNKTESQRREDSGRGSQMVKRHRPYPELRPAGSYKQLKATFDQDWLKEQRVARLTAFRAERSAKEPRTRSSERDLER